MTSTTNAILQTVLGCAVVAAGLVGASTVVRSFAESTENQRLHQQRRDEIALDTWRTRGLAAVEAERDAALPRPIWEATVGGTTGSSGGGATPPPVAEGFEIVVAPRADGTLEMPGGFVDPKSILYGRWLLWSLLRPTMTAQDMLPEFNQMMSQLELYDAPFTVEEAIDQEARRAYERMAARVIVLLHRIEFTRARDFVGHCLSAMDPTLFPDEALTERNLSFRRAWRLYDELAALARDYADVQAGREPDPRNWRDRRDGNGDGGKDGNRRER